MKDPLNLYIHTPFCRGKCAYCAFYSEPRADKADVRAWLEKLERKFSEAKPDRPLSTVYFGGGTPNVPEAEDMRRLYRMVRDSFPILPGAEISSECNPESLTPEKAEIMSSFPNRISMGIQSFSEANRKRIGRATPGSEALKKSIRLFRENGIRNIGLDLIYAVPGQTLENLKEDLDRALELEPEHLSAYSLTLDENSALGKNPPPDMPSEEASAEMWEFIGNYLKENGLYRYEVSNYARPGFECRHNEAVWHGERYLGFGPSACSFDGKKRWTAAAPLKKWLEDVAPEEDVISYEQRVREIFMMGLRTVRGWDEIPVEISKKELERFEREGLLEFFAEGCRPTEKGLLFWDHLAEELLL